ncbi:MAG TPA: hypothetical protein VE907_21260 [Gammaproteobacteria bacterium]|nr:hypothetical protein [Gammaproteobacteria bacterium]
MPTPSEYKKRYENIDVPLADGRTVPVTINKYRLAGAKVQLRARVNAGARTDFLQALAKHGIDTPLRIDTPNGIARVDPRVTQHEDALKKRQRDLLLTGSLSTGVSDLHLSGLGGYRDVRPLGVRRLEFELGSRMNTHVTDWSLLARYAFAGKGSPEACQVVLQLANAWGLATNVQAYADSALGLDCNGFVGNYLWHAKNGNPWTNLGLGNHDLGPDSPIRSGFHDHYQRHLLDRWESLDTKKMYVMMEVGKDGMVINGGDPSASSPGHIVITEPNGRADRPDKDPKKSSFAVKVVEATGGHTPEGLWESWYTCTGSNSRTKIFSVFRESMDAGHQKMEVKIAAVS